MSYINKTIWMIVDGTGNSVDGNNYYSNNDALDAQTTYIGNNPTSNTAIISSEIIIG
jgi:hypothetical protein